MPPAPLSFGDPTDCEQMDQSSPGLDIHIELTGGVLNMLTPETAGVTLHVGQTQMYCNVS